MSILSGENPAEVNWRYVVFMHNFAAAYFRCDRQLILCVFNIYMLVTYIYMRKNISC